MDRAQWLKKIRAQAEALYDHFAAAYWVKFGLYPNATHRQFIEKFLWLDQAGLAIAEEGTGDGYAHLLASWFG